MASNLCAIHWQYPLLLSESTLKYWRMIASQQNLNNHTEKHSGLKFFRKVLGNSQDGRVDEVSVYLDHAHNVDQTTSKLLSKSCTLNTSSPPSLRKTSTCIGYQFLGDSLIQCTEH